ncbi:origin recognition complex subunit Orc1 [Cymbomonas tetramitiformis]|uniref:Origin recognition complex subunit 1 n=1 Tax=Cymbomonas tetramitiformis TaxID=36881 RepID=A0AAE0GUV4_9CHLO|nr:origin recognition complex subunit Orc1 [Cymbomonas tetramitiformis]
MEGRRSTRGAASCQLTSKEMLSAVIRPPKAQTAPKSIPPPVPQNARKKIQEKPAATKKKSDLKLDPSKKRKYEKASNTEGNKKAKPAPPQTSSKKNAAEYKKRSKPEDVKKNSRKNQLQVAELNKAIKCKVPRKPKRQYFRSAKLNDEVYKVGDAVYVFSGTIFDEEEEDEEYCEICDKDTTLGTMLECDECLRGFHMNCLQPPLQKVPEAEWFCMECANATFGAKPPAPRRERNKTARERFLDGEVELARVERIWRDGLNKEFMFTARWYYRPEETHTGRQAHHTRREVFLSSVTDDCHSEAIYRHATVATPSEYMHKGNAGDDVYMCEYLYDATWQRFRRKEDEQDTDAAYLWNAPKHDAAHEAWEEEDEKEEGSSEDEDWMVEEEEMVLAQRRRANKPQKGQAPRAANRRQNLVMTKQEKSKAEAGFILFGHRKNIQGMGLEEVPAAPRAKEEGVLPQAKAALALAATPASLPCRSLARAASWGGDGAFGPGSGFWVGGGEGAFGSGVRSSVGREELPRSGFVGGGEGAWLSERLRGGREELYSASRSWGRGGELWLSERPCGAGRSFASGSGFVGREELGSGRPSAHRKTATVLEVMRALTKRQLDGELDPFQFVEVNGVKLPSPNHAYSTLWEALTGMHTSHARAAELLEAHFSRPPKKGQQRAVTVVLVDEMDLLITKNQTVLYNLFDWPLRAGSRLVMIGVANTMDMPDRLLPRIASRMSLHRQSFQPYTFKQLDTIITSRLEGCNAFMPAAIEFAARKVAAVSGDVRRVLELCRRAVELAQERQQSSDDAVASTSSPTASPAPAGAQTPRQSPLKAPAPAADLPSARLTSVASPSSAQNWGRGKGDSDLVTTEDIRAAVAELFSAPHMQLLEGLAMQQKVALLALLLELRQTGMPDAVLELVYERHIRLCRERAIWEPSWEQLAEAIAAMGYIHLLLCEPGRRGCIQKLALNVPTGDVEYVLKNDESLPWMRDHLSA